MLVSRLEVEYKVHAALEPSPWSAARWMKGGAEAVKAFAIFSCAALATDRDGVAVFLAKDAWELSYVAECNPAIRFSAIKERS